MTREFKVGDKVFDLGCGNGAVIRINEDKLYPIVCIFEDTTCSFTKCGKNYSEQKFPTLFHGHDLIIEVKEPEYEWQFIWFKTDVNRHFLSQDFYKSIDDFHRYAFDVSSHPFEPSKRLVKRG